jgi:hypothetical protein
MWHFRLSWAGLCLYDACGLTCQSPQLQCVGVSPRRCPFLQSLTIECTAQLCVIAALDLFRPLGRCGRLYVKLLEKANNAERGFEKVWVGCPV